MKRIILILFFTLHAVALCAQEHREGIRFFEGILREALELAGKDNKLVFVDCSGTWCGGCRKMEKEVFPLKEVGDVFNANFICLHRMMNVEGEGEEISKKYNITGYPTWLFLNGNGYVVHMDAGFMEPDKFVALAHAALAAPRVGAKERFDNGERDETFIKGYLERLMAFKQADEVDYVLDKLYREQGGEILTDPDYWFAFTVCTYDTDAPTALYLTENWEKLAAIYGEDVILQKIRNLYINWGAYAGLTDNGKIDNTKKEVYLSKMRQRGLPGYEKLQQEMNFMELLQEKRYEEAYTMGERILKDADARTLRNWAVLAEKKFNGRELRQKATTWVKRAMQMRDDAAFRSECEAVLEDLTGSDSPVYGASRPSMPMRGYTDGFSKGKK